MELLVKVHNVHQRELDATPDSVGAVLATTGQADDRVSPAHPWPPDMRIRLDGPVSPGAAGGHGAIPYSVVAHEPGRRLKFRFEKGSGLDGTHGFELQPLAGGRSRVVHVLEGRTSPVTWFAVRPFHDAYVEAVLDRIEEETTGRVAVPTRVPTPIRAVNAASRVWQRWQPSARAVRLSATAVPVAVGAAAAIHGAWALGWRWPGGSDQAWAERVGGSSQVPPAWASMGVGLTLAGFAAAVAATTRSEGAGPRALASLAAAAFGLRGLAGPPTTLLSPSHLPYDRLDLTLYSPLCLALALGSASVVRDAQRRAVARLTAPPGVRSYAA